jgi:ABC-2 type transport system ATP-binding protein
VSHAIVAESLRKRYGSTLAVADVSLRVAEGEIFGLIGPNGAGKSTTVRILATLTRPDAGRACVVGFDVTRRTREVRGAIGYVAQGSHADAYLSGRENLALQARMQRLGRAEAHARATELLERVGLESVADRLVATYSGGLRRRLDLAMALVHRPRVLFLDEPTTGLDPEARSALWAELAQLAQEQTLTVLLTTHYLEEADRLAGRVAIVARGTVIAEGAPDELKQALQGDSVTFGVRGRAAGALSTVRAVDGVEGARLIGGLLTARVDQGARALPAILTALDRRGIEVDSATMTRPTLDDVYLHLTGSTVARDNAAG